MIEVIKKMNGQWVVCRSTTLVEEVRTFYVEDEFGQKVLCEDQITGDPVEIELKDLKSIKMHNIIKRNIEMQLTNSVDTKKSKKRSFDNHRKLDVVALLMRMKINYRDNRPENGRLWIRESQDFKRHLNTFRQNGFYFEFVENSNALNNRSGWYLKS